MPDRDLSWRWASKREPRIRYTHRAEVDVASEDPRGYPVPMRAVLSYTSDDPWAVRLTVGGAVSWVFARDLLAAGTSGHGRAETVGEGHVRLRSRPPEAPSVVQHRRVVLELLGANATVELSADREVLAGFVHRTYTAVPPGAEPRWVDLDALAAALVRPDLHRPG